MKSPVISTIRKVVREARESEKYNGSPKPLTPLLPVKPVAPVKPLKPLKYK